MNLERAILLVILAARGDAVYLTDFTGPHGVQQFTRQPEGLADIGTALTDLQHAGHLTATKGSREDTQGRPLLAYFLTPKGRNRVQT